MDVEVPQILKKSINAKTAQTAALVGLDMLVRMQVSDYMDGNFGRYPYLFNYHASSVDNYSTNWTTGITVDAMLMGYKLTEEKKYLDSVDKAVSYIKSLQCFAPEKSRVYGALNEVTPQGDSAHPRDGLTAALALLDYSVVMQDSHCEARARIFADWFCDIANERGYPYWTVRFDDSAWQPEWYGSFHSGSAYFLCRCFKFFGDEKYIQTAQYILDHYNSCHLSANGDIAVIFDPKTQKIADGYGDPRWTTPGWEMMHRYNDDFGTLANLFAWKITGIYKYYQAAECFLKKMVRIQRDDGGFGPADFSIPSAGGTVLIELLEARKNGMEWIKSATLDRAAEYLLELQCVDENCDAAGGFLGFQEPEYVLNGWINLRSTAYAIIALLKYSGLNSRVYSV